MSTHEGNYVDKTDSPAPQTFEIGLVMAGAISAGPYEAGVLNYLFEALDAWEQAKARTLGTSMQASIPQHKVVIKVVTGASAGSISAAIMAVAARYDFPHLSCRELGVRGYAGLSAREREQIDEVASHNPFFKSWVQDISIDKLLTTKDLDSPDSVVQSLLDSSSLLDITQACLSYQGRQVVHRPYLANPTRYLFSITNLRGIPYFLQLGSEQGVGLGMSMHRDYRSFTISYSQNAVATQIRGDDIALDWSPATAKRWQVLGMTAVASGAFPLALAPRPMTRVSSDYNYRFVVLPGDGAQPARAVRLQPNPLRTPVPEFSTFLIDGGTMNNEPLDLARQELAGLTSRNERSGLLAKRCILMIDPFPDTQAQGHDEPAGMTPVLTSVIGDLIGAWKNQARFSPQDLALAADEEIYSRFLIAPSRGNAAPSGLALAGGALGGFSGFLSRDFRQHDYLLGRRNAQKFLSHVFTLPAGNNLFDGLDLVHKQEGAKWARKGIKGIELPIIPLMDDLLPAALSGNRSNGKTEELSDWPFGIFQIESIRDDIERRMNSVIDHYIEHWNISWGRKILSKTLAMTLRGHVYDRIIVRIQEGLAAGGLNPPPRASAEKPAPTRHWFTKVDTDS
ncbi:patatin-like phospholipase domain-containing protein [Pseudomonas chlororaphis]|uniref:patatin-like phospholipase family protein n=1 Tax=Pseudomonas chlororaphis TaxID=587753 RepID=UPI000BE376CC|nr:patatin-like phospholipase family protein [Pseudomonas chlororaphis]